MGIIKSKYYGIIRGFIVGIAFFLQIGIMVFLSMYLIQFATEVYFVLELISIQNELDYYYPCASRCRFVFVCHVGKEP